MLILHGEHTIKSRARLTQVLEKARAQGMAITRLSCKQLTVAELEEQLGHTSLFGTPELLVIEELQSLPPSARKKDLIALLAQHAAASAPAESTAGPILWEKRSLTKTMLKPFTGAQVEEFPLSTQLWAWLESLGKSNSAQLLQQAHQLYHSDSAGFVWAMLTRQVRLLLSAKDDGQLKGAPFMISKLKSQADKFTLEKLLAVHQQLLEIDRKLKTSGTPLTLEQQLDLLILSL